MNSARALQLAYLDRTAPLRGAESVLGRSMYCSVVIAHPSVSRVHASIQRLAGQLVIHDLGSKNGTFLNGNQVDDTPVAIDVGDVIRLGDVDCRLQEFDPNQQSSTTDRPTEPEIETTQRIPLASRKMDA